MTLMPLINDQYRQNRGGWSRLLQIDCATCDTPVCHYQKDGSGPLKRMYLDRIVNPKLLDDNQECLVCPHCQATLGVRDIYTKENRPIIRLFAYAVKSKIKPSKV